MQFPSLSQKILETEKSPEIIIKFSYNDHPTKLYMKN